MAGTTATMPTTTIPSTMVILATMGMAITITAGTTTTIETAAVLRRGAGLPPHCHYNAASWAASWRDAAVMSRLDKGAGQRQILVRDLRARAAAPVPAKK